MPKVYIAARPKLVVPGLLDHREADVHITMAYLGDQDLDAVMAALAEKQYHRWPNSPILCQINGTAQWVNAEGGFVQVALVQPVIPRIQEHDIYKEREHMLSSLSAAGIYPDKTYPFVPHITLGYSSGPEAHIPMVKAPVMFAITNFHASYQDDQGEWHNEPLMSGVNFR